MSVVNFRLSPDQSEPSRYVEVIADDGNVRVTAQIDRRALVELIHWDTPQREREAFVKRNLPQFAGSSDVSITPKITRCMAPTQTTGRSSSPQTISMD